MSITNRRLFLLTTLAAAGGSALAATPAAPTTPAAPAGSKVDEKDPQAVALGYVTDTKRADVKKFPKHSADQKCANCALYQGKPTDAQAPCPLFANRIVMGPGWCSSWVKKA